MKRTELINILNKYLPNDWKISDKVDKDIETSSIYIGRYSERLGSYITNLKCFTYSGKYKESKITNRENDIWYFHFYMDGDNKEFIIPNDESCESFIEIFINRYVIYLDLKKEIDKVANSIFILSSKKIKEEIREHKINKVIKSENQE